MADHFFKQLVKNKVRAGLKTTAQAAETVVKTPPKPKAKPKPKAPRATTPKPPPQPKQVQAEPVSPQQKVLDKKTADSEKVKAEARKGRVFVPESQGEHLIKRQEKIGKVGLSFDQARESIDDIKLSNPGKTNDQLKKESPEFKQSMRVLEGAQAELSSIESNVLPFTPDDPKAFPRGIKAADELKDEDLARNGERGQRHIHHMLPKGMTSAFFERMDQFINKGLATNKMIVAMAEIAKSMNLRTGDARSNLKVMAADPHNGIHRAMEHKPINGQAAEISKQELQKQLRKVKTPKQLMKVWKEWLETDGRYLKDTAEIWEDLDKLIKEIQST